MDRVPTPKVKRRTSLMNMLSIWRYRLAGRLRLLRARCATVRCKIFPGSRHDLSFVRVVPNLGAGRTPKAEEEENSETPGKTKLQKMGDKRF